MKKTIIFYAFLMSLLFFPYKLMARQNLRDGYVITLAGDTLRGVIDFRTAVINTKKCVFRQDGATTFTTYLPGEIEGYRFTANGIYYVSKEITTKGNGRQKVFAEYVKEMCPDGTCEPYEYKSQSTPNENRVVHPWIKVGFKATQYKFKNYGSITGYAPQISVGADFHLNRLLKGLMINFGLAFEPGRASRNASEVRDDLDPLEQNKIPIKVKFNQFDAMFGPGYQFQTGKLKTSVKAGIIYRVISHNLESTLGYYSSYEGCEVPSVEQDNIEWKFDSQMGYYGGVGLEYPIGKFSLTCDFEYIYDFNIWSKYARPWVTIFKQQGLCLSVGLKY